jgi:hypothetical protein
MTTPTLDIIIPVWNSPAETRGCLVSVMESAQTARLIIINNGCDRTTELMLEEICDHLGERALYLTMERNIGFVPAVNRALKRSEADWCIILRPTTIINPHCIQQLLQTTTLEQAGLVTPRCLPEIPLPTQLLKSNCTTLETCEISFVAIAISKVMRETIGLFDEELDGGPWCLKDYRYRADAHGFRTYLAATVTVEGQPAALLGSLERRRRLVETARTICQQRWGTQEHLAIYLPKETDEEKLNETLKLLLSAARHGHLFELFLHGRQYHAACKSGATCLHCGITLHKLPALFTIRRLARTMTALTTTYPQLQTVCGLDDTHFPGFDSTLPHTKLFQLAKL